MAADRVLPSWKNLLTPQRAPLTVPERLAPMAPIDVIIPTYRRTEAALDVAHAAAEQLDIGEYVTIVVQQGRMPGDATPRVRMIESSPPNLPRARNAGVAATAADIVLFLDDDVTVLPGLIAAFRAAFDDPAVGGIAGYVDDPLFDRSRLVPSTFVEETGEIFQNFSLERDADTISVMGANMAFRRSALQSVRGFDELFKRNALWEDIDISFRLTKAGWRLRYCAAARVQHQRLDGGCRTDRAGRYLYHQFANTAYFACRHIPRRYWRSWLQYWKYRLEFLSRTKNGGFRHDPILVAAGLLGACAGVARSMTRNH
jgi:GT2 family glycosyltransferase